MKEVNLDDLLAAYAVDAVDGDEARLVESAVAADPTLRNELDSYRAVAAILAEAPETETGTPPLPRIWDRIAQEVAGTDRTDTPDLASISELRRQRRWSRFAAAVSVAAVAVSVTLGVRLIDLQSDIAQQDVASLAAATVTQAGSEVVELLGQEGYEGHGARIVVGADGFGYLLSHTLDPLASDRTYQLWAIVPGTGDEPFVISAGVLGNDPGISQFQFDADVVGFAITEEVAGGVPASEGDTVSLWLRG